MTTDESIKYIDFVARGSASLYSQKEDKPIFQLGVQTCSAGQSATSSLEYFLIRIASTFGINGWKIKEGRIDVKLSCDVEGVVVHDMFPRRSETMEESGILEIGLDSNLAWGPVSLLPYAKYQTKMQRIRSNIESGGLLDKHAWWKFTTRKGESHIGGTIETFLTIQSPKQIPVHLLMTLTGLGKKISVGEEVSFSFTLNSD